MENKVDFAVATTITLFLLIMVIIVGHIFYINKNQNMLSNMQDELNDAQIHLVYKKWPAYCSSLKEYCKQKEVFCERWYTDDVCQHEELCSDSNFASINQLTECQRGE